MCKRYFSACKMLNMAMLSVTKIIIVFCFVFLLFENRLSNAALSKFISPLTSSVFQSLFEDLHLGTVCPVPGNARLWEGETTSAGLVVSFFNQINPDLTENNFCLLMASRAFEVAGGTAGFEVCACGGSAWTSHSVPET